MFSKETYIQRRQLLRERVSRGGIILLPGNGEAPRNYPDNAYHFRQDSNFLYFFGIQQPDLVGLLDIDAGEDWLFGDDLSMDDIIWTGPQPTVHELGASVGVTRTGSLAQLQETLTLAIRKGRHIHFLPPYRGDNKLKLCAWLGLTPDMVAHRISVELAIAIVSLRDKKSDDEIREIEEACEIGYRMHTTAMRMCRPGVRERDIAGAIEGVTLEMGDGVSFHSIVTQHGETLHNHSHNGILESGRMLLVDAGAENLMNYCSDFTRTYPVNGKFTPMQRDIYNIVLAANARAFELARPGILYRDVHFAAVRVILEGLSALGLVKGNLDDAVEKGVHALFMPHGLGHMMGLDVHDMEDIGEKYVGYDLETERSNQLGVSNLRMARRLQTGMVMTDEPGIYFIPAYIAKWKNEGLNKEFINFDKLEPYMNFGGVRIEDDLLITETGNRILGKRRIPVTVEEIETFMAGN
ncbi:MAG TPA: aminopeptidase P family protein [Candidatus Tidjanibacter faecipullorum]|uniref:Xaa-Pro aminopeptidase n=1 Tax=Candidatus Tidjanibacter faecipullorum TaxID=2838766 RepID=A0A9D2IM33_9BACT|nr:aminopeptidase P family protein [Candidatus Tidjanibacter faecipullorum]